MGVVDRFHGLRHNSIVSGGDQHHNVRGFRAARTHTRKGLVAGRIEEYDFASIGRRRLVGNRNLIGADVLRNATRFASGDIGGANGIE